MPSYAVVCASHGGIGPEYVRQLAGRSDTIVFAIVPNPAESTHLNTLAASLKNVHIIAGDVADYNMLEHSAQRVSGVTGGTLDYLIHDAAEVDVDTGSEGLDDQKKLDGELKSAVVLNLLGPTRSITAFLPLLRASNTKKIVVIGLGPADLKTVQTRNVPNMCRAFATAFVATKFASELKYEGFVVVAFAPGVVDLAATAEIDGREYASSVKNDTGVRVATRSLEESVAAQLTDIDEFEPSRNGMVSIYLGRDDSASS